MYDGGKIITGLIIFVAIVTFPLWYNIGKTQVIPEPSLNTPIIQQLKVKKCIEPKQFMIDKHMELLNEWRNQVVRGDKDIFVNTAGQDFTMSLEDTCFHCHSNEKQFCDQCHSYVNIKPYCWECHVKPGEEITHGH